MTQDFSGHVRNKYDTFIVYLYKNNQEKILPVHFRKSIPASTISTWRNNTDLKSYTRHEYVYIQNEAIAREIILMENKKLKSIINLLIKTWVIFKVSIKRMINDSKERQLIIDAIQLLSTKMNVKTACHIFNVSYHTYHSWIFQVKHRCKESLNSLCFKRHKNQLSVSEVNTIKKMLFDPGLFHWPVSSIAYYAIKEKISSVGISTWYKYAKLLGVKRKVRPKRIKKIGLIGNYPNEYWHIDTTQYDLENEETIYITFVIDNFSRMILGYHMSTRNAWQNVKNALQQAVNTFSSGYHHSSVNLVADGGHENHHTNVKDFLRGLKNIDINILTALKDITYSNSAVEATHRTIKGFYLNHLSFYSIEKLNEYIQNFVLKDFNEIRPHGSLHGLTPYEKYTQPQKVLSFSSQFSLARKIRIEENSNFNCSICNTNPLSNNIE